jgi:predicted ATPase
MQYAENVVEFMAQDLRNLPERTLRLLKVAAFFGGRFDIRDIAQYCRVAVEEEERVLWPALQQGNSLFHLIIKNLIPTITLTHTCIQHGHTSWTD